MPPITCHILDTTLGQPAASVDGRMGASRARQPTAQKCRLRKQPVDQSGARRVPDPLPHEKLLSEARRKDVLPLHRYHVRGA
ncbi:hypothetical protein KL943_004381 [Ogataea angusta]|nr:hypothetical protein KL943_004381 [Ogataea angusta]